MDDAGDMLALVGRIYDAALDPALWPRFLVAFASAYPGGQGALYSLDSRKASVVLASWDPAWTRAHNSYFHATNPWLPKMRARPAGVTNAAEELLPMSEFRRSEYFNDFLRPQGIRTGVGATVFRKGDRIVGISVLYGSEETEAHHHRRLSRLVPHLARAVEVNLALAGASFERRAAEAILNHLDHAAAVVDAEGSALLFNRKAEDLFARDGAALALRADGRVEVRGSPAHTAELHRLVHSAAVGPLDGARQAPGGWLRLPRSGEGAPVSVLVAPLRDAPDLPILPVREAAILFILDPRAERPVCEADLRRRFALTAAEARVAGQVARGIKPGAIADALGLRASTVRQYLKAVLAKTGTHSQVELVRLLQTKASVVPGREEG